MTERKRRILRFHELDRTKHSEELVGADHGVPFSLILVHSEPGDGPRLHRHPYPEVFIVESGQATFQVGGNTVVVDEGHVVVSPSGEPHGFTNSGSGQLPLIAIHGAARFAREWLAGEDPTWRSRARQGTADSPNDD